MVNAILPMGRKITPFARAMMALREPRSKGITVTRSSDFLDRLADWHENPPSRQVRRQHARLRTKARFDGLPRMF